MCQAGTVGGFENGKRNKIKSQFLRLSQIGVRWQPKRQEQHKMSWVRPCPCPWGMQLSEREAMVPGKHNKQSTASPPQLIGDSGVVYAVVYGVADMVPSYLYHFPIFRNSSGKLLSFLSPLGLCGMVPTSSFILKLISVFHTPGYTLSTWLQPGQWE